MKTLVILSGLPGCGKSTLVEHSFLKPYVISTDAIRLLYGSIEPTESGGMRIPMDHDKKVFKLVNNLLKERMARGEFIVLDATNVNSDHYQTFRQLKDVYRYRVVMVDFSDVPVEQCKQNNKRRSEYKRVPDYVIDRMHEDLMNRKIPSWMTVIKPHEAKEALKYVAIDFSKWKKIHHIGDIHGCFTVLKEYLDRHFVEDELFIFTGDFLERGTENAKTLMLLNELVNKENVILVEGNHERNIRNWSNGVEEFGRSFKTYVVKELNEAKVSKKDTRNLCRKLRDAVLYRYGDKEVLVTHGGLTNRVENLLVVPSVKLIRGVGDYETDIDTIFTANVEDYEETFESDVKHYQVHGHRNQFGRDVQTGRSFNLEGSVEYGGSLRVVTLDNSGFNCIELENKVFNKELEVKEINDLLPIDQYVKVLDNNSYIRKKDNGNGVYSFNFTEKAFYKGVWNNQTVKARGLHIDVESNELVVRSYDKSFNMNELEETELKSLKKNLTFPLVGYEKYNGFLGLIGYHKRLDRLYITSKGDSNSKYAEMFRKLAEKELDLDKVKDYVKETDSTLAFEVILHKEDPHFIEYDRDHLVLLDVVKNKILFEKLPYEELVSLANKLNIKVKEKFVEFKEWDEFESFLIESEKEHKQFPDKNRKNVEGYMFEDMNGYMFKKKNNFYVYWKTFRKILNIARKQLAYEHLLENDEFGKAFVKFSLLKVPAKGDINILKLRKEFFEHEGID